MLSHLKTFKLPKFGKVNIFHLHIVVCEAIILLALDEANEASLSVQTTSKSEEGFRSICTYNIK